MILGILALAGVGGVYRGPVLHTCGRIRLRHGG
jgi:hypothetical protein